MLLSYFLENRDKRWKVALNCAPEDLVANAEVLVSLSRKSQPLGGTDRFFQDLPPHRFVQGFWCDQVDFTSK
jgi:hypothetical protein